MNAGGRGGGGGMRGRSGLDEEKDDRSVVCRERVDGKGVRERGDEDYSTLFITTLR